MFCFSGNISGWRRVERFTIRSKDEMELRLLSQGIRHTSLPPSLSLSATHAHTLILSLSLPHTSTLILSFSFMHTHTPKHTHSHTRTFFPLLFWSSREHKGLRVFHSIFVLFCLALNLSLLHKLSLSVCLSLSFFYFAKRNPNQVMMEQLSFLPDFFFFFQIFERFMFFSSRCC